jgi:hypothetical protein
MKSGILRGWSNFASRAEIMSANFLKKGTLTVEVRITSETVLCPMSPCIHVVATFFGDFLELNVTFCIFFLFLDFSPHVTTFILSYTFIMSVFSNFRTPFSHCKKKSDLDRQFFFIVWGIWGSISYLVYYFYMSPQSFFATISFIQHLAPKIFSSAQVVWRAFV